MTLVRIDDDGDSQTGNLRGEDGGNDGSGSGGAMEPKPTEVHTLGR